jgi:1,4-dihydroxy-2-naphthoate octaprenyltransferase
MELVSERAMSPAKNFLIHLRLPFQALLAPFMLFGAALAAGRPTWRFGLAFAVLHVCFYGGTTAFNSHYDKDEGPIGGLEAPPPPGRWLLPGSLVLQAIGLVLAAVVGWSFVAVCAAFAILGAAYSHPLTRLKGKPWPSWLTVMIGQGALGAIAGVTAIEAPRITGELAFGVIAAAAIVGAIYPLSQVFQIDEDARRGDRTVAMMLGRAGTPRVAGLLFAIGSVLMALAAWRAGRRFDAALFACAPVPLTLGVAWACRPAGDRAIFRRVALFQIAASSAFGLYALARLVL